MDRDTKETIKITVEDLAAVALPEGVVSPAAAPIPQGSGKSYGTLNTAAEDLGSTPDTRGSILLQGWFYLGLAGLIGSLVGWSICEHAFVDGPGRLWGNLWMLPLILTFMCLGFGIAESVVERSTRKALIRAAMALPLGVVLGFIFDFVANLLYNINISICVQMGAQSYRNPALWLARGIAWMVFGVAGGVVYGIVGQSAKKAKFGILGGIIGAGIGGAIFDPIAFMTQGGAVSRIVGFLIMGCSTGIAMGLVESALKDRWLYVTAGPLAGKQFILYKPQTVMGSRQDSDIYLFKDQTILPHHAMIEINGARVQMRATGNVYVSGQPVSVRPLQDGDLVQVGRYSFRYKEKQRS
jgi:hypothetical protein